MSSADEAQKQIDAMISDPATAELLNQKDPTTVAKWNRLNDAQATFRKAAAGRR